MATALETPLMTALSVETWHLALSRPDARDKLFRLVQYACKLVRGAQAGSSEPTAHTAAARAAALEGAVGLSRQMWRLLKWVSVYAAPRSTARAAAQCEMRELCALVSDGALFAYLVLDNITFVHRARVVPGDVSVASRRAARFWLVAVLASGVAAAHAAVTLLKRRRAARRALEAAKKKDAPGSTLPSATAEMRAQVHDINARLARALAVLGKHSADAVVAGSLTREKPLHPSLVGMLGVFSSAVGLWQAWPRRAASGGG